MAILISGYPAETTVVFGSRIKVIPKQTTVVLLPATGRNHEIPPIPKSAIRSRLLGIFKHILICNIKQPLTAAWP